MRAVLLFAVLSFILYSCSTGNKMQSSVQNDDVYVDQTAPYVQPDVVNAESQSDSYTPSNQDQYGSNPSPDNTTSEKYTDENGTTYITNNYYEGSNYDFYGNDNSYASRLDRWYNPAFGFGYFSPFYTGFSYYDPFYSPGFNLSFSFGFGNGWYDPFYPSFYYNPWYSSYYNPWYSPYYYGYNNYWNGYYDGYYNGYYSGYGNDYYGNGFGNSNSSYGPHGSASSNTSGNGDGRHFKLADEIGSNTNNPVIHSAPGSEVISGKNTGTPVQGNTIVKSETKVIPSQNIKSGSQHAEPSVPQNSNPRSVPSSGGVKPAPPVHQNTDGNHPRMNTQAPVSNPQLVPSGASLEVRDQKMPSVSQEKNQVTPVIINSNKSQQKTDRNQQRYSKQVSDPPSRSQKATPANNDDRPALNGNNSSRNNSQDNNNSRSSGGGRNSDGGSRRR